MGLVDKLKRPAAPIALWSPRPELLLHPNIPKPMHEVCPRNLLGEEWWDETRRAAYRRTHNCCAACGVPATLAKERPGLEGHEVYEIDYRRGRMKYIETVGLCHYCHSYIHLGRLETLVGAGTESKAKLQKVVNHGNKVLRGAGLEPPFPPKPHEVAEWGKWRLALFGKLYPPKFKDYEDWKAHWAGDEG